MWGRVGCLGTRGNAKGFFCGSWEWDLRCTLRVIKHLVDKNFFFIFWMRLILIRDLRVLVKNDSFWPCMSDKFSSVNLTTFFHLIQLLSKNRISCISWHVKHVSDSFFIQIVKTLSPEVQHLHNFKVKKHFLDNSFIF